MGYLTVDSLKQNKTITYKKEKILLLEPAGEKKTFISDEVDNDTDERVDLSSKVFIKQRWKIKVLPPDKFTKEFITHRYIEVYYCLYGDLLNEQEKIYTAWDVQPHRDIDSNSLGDDFKDIY